MFDYLPNSLQKEIARYGLNCINEIRIRKDCPVVIIVNGDRVKLNKIVLTESDIENVVYKVCKGSIHSFDDQILNGYISDNNGVRIGLAGEFVMKNGKVFAIRRYSSLCIRVPNAIKGVSDEFFNGVYAGGSVLVISPPGVGKTSFIRDFVNNLCKNNLKNVVVVDERDEISMKTSSGNTFLNSMVDVLVYATKDYGFNQAIRTLNPDVIVTDEIMSVSDVNSIINAIYGGVNVIATVHGNSLADCFFRSCMNDLKVNKVFDYIVLIILNDKKREYLYFDKDFNQICLS